jgi:hypothetical protein
LGLALFAQGYNLNRSQSLRIAWHCQRLESSCELVQRPVLSCPVLHLLLLPVSFLVWVTSLREPNSLHVVSPLRNSWLPQWKSPPVPLLRSSILGCHATFSYCWRAERIHGSVFELPLPSSDSSRPEHVTVCYCCRAVSEWTAADTGPSGQNLAEHGTSVGLAEHGTSVGLPPECRVPTTEQ